MRRRHFAPQLKLGVAIAVILCLLSVLYSAITGNQSPVTALAGFVAKPFQSAASGVTGFLSKGTSYFSDFDALQAENAALKQQLREMEQQVRDAAVALEENDRLRAEHGLSERDRSYTFETAEVIGRNPGDWAEVLTLDKGSSSGVQVDNVVTTEDGMVGFVSAVGPNTCEVTTVIDVELQCGALVTRTREAAIAEGSYDLMAEGALRLSYLKENADVVIGDTVETSGTGGVFPKGIMIGTVEGLLPETNGITYYAVVKPYVDVKAVTGVSIITDYSITE